MHFDYLIIGGGAAGTTAAETIRSLDDTGTIAIISDEPHRLYSRVLLPHYVKGVVAEAQVFLRQSPMYDAKRINLLARCRVLSLEDSKTVTTDRYGKVEFGKLLIATGGRPRVWALGDNFQGVHSFQTLEDAIRIKMNLPTAKHLVIVGGGFMGLEFAAAAVKYKVSATVIVRKDWYWYHSLTKIEAHVVHRTLTDLGIEIITNDDVARVEGGTAVTAVVLQSGRRIETDIIGLGIGLSPNVEFLNSAVSLGQRGILANEYLQTSIAHIYAAGDVAEFVDPILGIRHQLGTWANAVHHGRVAGANMAGKETRLGQVASYSTNALPGLHVSFVGDGRNDGENQNICRYDEENNSYGRLILKNGRIVGGIFLNRPQDVAATMKLIESKKEITVHSELSDINFDLKTLLV